MKRACFAVLMCWLAPAAALAAPCVPGTLASYISLGATGCSVGGASFYNFTNLALQGGASPIADNSTFVNPLDVLYRPGLRFDVNAQDAPGGNFLQRIIGYSVTNAGITGNSVSLTGSAVTPDGAIDAIENKCLGAVFGPAQSCSGTPAQLTAFDLGLFGQQLTQQMTFARTSLLGVVLNIGVDAGTDGSARLTSATTQFTAVPEPGTMTLLGIGLTAGVRSWRKRFCRSIAG